MHVRGLKLGLRLGQIALPLQRVHCFRVPVPAEPTPVPAEPMPVPKLLRWKTWGNMIPRRNSLTAPVPAGADASGAGADANPMPAEPEPAADPCTIQCLHCQEDMTPPFNEDTMLLQCGHRHHTNCVNTYLEVTNRSIEYACPAKCDWPLPAPDFPQLQDD